MSETAARAQPLPIWCPHVTVASVIEDAGRFLMVEESIHGRLCLNQPAGHLEDGETLPEAARREALEETGWDVELEHLLCVQQWHSPVHDHHSVRFAFAGRAVREHPERSLDAGIVRAVWLSYAEIAAAPERLRSPLVLATLAAFRTGQRFPLTLLRSLLPARPVDACSSR